MESTPTGPPSSSPIPPAVTAQLVAPEFLSSSTKNNSSSGLTSVIPPKSVEPLCTPDTITLPLIDSATPVIRLKLPVPPAVSNEVAQIH